MTPIGDILNVILKCLSKLLIRKPHVEDSKPGEHETDKTTKHPLWEGPKYRVHECCSESYSLILSIIKSSE